MTDRADARAASDDAWAKPDPDKLHEEATKPNGHDDRAAAEPAVIQVINGELPMTVDLAEGFLIERDPDLYEFGDQVVRPALKPIRISDDRKTVALRLIPVKLHHMIERFTRHVDFRRYNKKEKKWLSVDCPEAVAKTYLERVGLWKLPKITALTSCPTLLPDGRIIEQPGFDHDSGVLFDAQGTTFPPVPKAPNQEDARAALDTLKQLFAEFPFVDDRATAVMLSALLTSVSRLAYDFAPLHGFDAPAAGTGKSKLVDCCVILVTGHEAPVISQGDDETEFEKRLGAELLEGNRLISIDNCEAPLGGSLLCQAATQPFLKVRILGQSKSPLIVNSSLLFATGNNLRLYGDMLRRGLICHLDTGQERPELRTFEQEDPMRVLKRERGRYAVAALTILHAYNIAGRPVKQRPLGGFESWSSLVRDALLWLGQADPVETIESARTEDPDRQHLEAVVLAWHGVLENRAVTTRTVVDEADRATSDRSDTVERLVYANPELRAALLEVATDRSGRLSSQRLGNWLGRNKGKVVGDLRLAAAGLLDGFSRWRVEQRQPDGRWQ